MPTVFRSALGAAGAGGEPSPYWITLIDGLSTTFGTSEPSVGGYDSSNNYSFCINNQIASVNTDGDLNWARTVTGFPFSDVVVAPGGDVYGIGTSTYASIVKLNSSGTMQWWRKLGTAERFTGAGVDTSGNVYGFGRSADPSGSNGALVAKFNSSGTLQWHSIFGSANNDIFYGGTVQRGGTQPWGTGTDQTSGYNAIMYKINASNGTLTLGRKDFGVSFMYGIACDSSGNAYATDGSTYLFKINSSGTFQWGRNVSSLEGTGSRLNFQDTDSSDNIYGCYSNGSNSGTGVCCSLNSSGTKRWAIKVGYTGVTLTSRALLIDGNDDLIFCCTASGAVTGLAFIKLPNDGSITGTYGDTTISTATFSPTTQAATISSSSMTRSTSYSATTVTPATTTPSTTVDGPHSIG